MATINIKLEKESIKKAIRELEKVEDKLNTSTPRRFLRLCADWVIKTANSNLQTANIGQNIIADITNQWDYMYEYVKNNVIRVSNRSDKAVFIEFGVGKVGKSKSHPNAKKEGYEYDVKSKSKDKHHQWRFNVDSSEDIDLVVSYYRNDDNKITTKGSPANLFVYNALMDLQTKGIARLFWQQALKETI